MYNKNGIHVNYEEKIKVKPGMWLRRSSGYKKHFGDCILQITKYKWNNERLTDDDNTITAKWIWRSRDGIVNEGGYDVIRGQGDEPKNTSWNEAFMSYDILENKQELIKSIFEEILGDSD